MGSKWLRAQSAAAAAQSGPTAKAVGPAPIPASVPWKQFEVEAALYAWDLHDEGVEQVLDNVQGMAAVNSVYIIGQMHPERRPETSATYSHNPVRPLSSGLRHAGELALRSRALWAHQAAALRLRVAGRHRLDARIRRCGTQTRSARRLRVLPLVGRQTACGGRVSRSGEPRLSRKNVPHVRDWLRPSAPTSPTSASMPSTRFPRSSKSIRSTG